MYKNFSIIVACSTDGGIGYNNEIPWKLSDDLKNFKKITSTVNDPNKKNIIIMGRSTWESLPIKPLPNRLNIVLTNNPEYEIDKKAIVAYSMEDAMMYACGNNIESVFVIGGSQIYNDCLDNYKSYIDKIYLSIVFDKHYECDKFIDLNKILLNYNIKEQNVIVKDRYIFLIATNDKL